MRVIIAGSRDIRVDYCLDALDMLFRRERHVLRPTEIVSGGARGPDTAGEMWAKRNGIPVTPFIPAWERHGKKAGILRNEEMARYAAEQPGGTLIAFWDGESPGTKNMIENARKYRLRRFVRRVDWNAFR